MLNPLSAIFVAVGIAIIVLLALCAKGHTECLHSAQAVWSAHDGAHATWDTRHGKKCWFARDGKYRTEAKFSASAVTSMADAIPLPRPAVRGGRTEAAAASPPTPRGLIAVEHDQFKTWTTDATSVSTSVPLGPLFLQDRMISAGLRLWLQASVERARLARARLPPSL